MQISIHCLNMTSMFWGGDAKRAFIAQKRAIRTILNLQRSYSCRRMFRSLCYLTLAGIYMYEWLLFIFNNRERFVKFEPQHDGDVCTIKIGHASSTISYKN